MIQRKLNNIKHKSNKKKETEKNWKKIWAGGTRPKKKTKISTINRKNKKVSTLKYVFLYNMCV